MDLYLDERNMAEGLWRSLSVLSTICSYNFVFISFILINEIKCRFELL